MQNDRNVETHVIMEALRILADDLETTDMVVSSCLIQAASRLGELEYEISQMRKRCDENTGNS